MYNRVAYLRKVLASSPHSTPEKISVYFKTGKGGYAENDKFIGITVPVLRKIAKEFMTLHIEEIGPLIQSPINEERLLALIIFTGQHAGEKPERKEEIYQFYRTNIHHINNWNLVDSSAHLIIGAHRFK